jgi:hypothetical protein
MWPSFLWGIAVSGLTTATLFWWMIPLYDVNDNTDQPISKLRSLIGQTLLIITIMASSSLVQITIAGVLWRRWINTETKLHSKILLPIMSGMNPILWSWRYINVEIIIITLFGLVLHLAIGVLQTQITVKYRAKLYDQAATWLPPTLAPFAGNLSNPLIAQELSAIVTPITRDDVNADEVIGTIACAAIGLENMKYSNDTLHFYIAIPKLDTKIEQVAYHTNSTYSIINQTHVAATINGDNGTFCITTFYRSPYAGTWIGCNINQYGYIFYDQTDYYNNKDNVLNINNATTIRYELVQQCYHMWQVMNGTEYSQAQPGCDQAYVSAVLGFDNVLEVLLYNLNSAQNLGLGIDNALTPLTHLKTVGSDMDLDVQNNLATAILTVCTWAYAYELYHGTVGSYIYPYTLQYFTSGDINNKWLMIIIIPILVTAMGMFNLRNINTKMSRKLTKQYWMLESLIEEGEWRAEPKNDKIILTKCD